MKKVFDAIQETGYRPNLLARRLAVDQEDQFHRLCGSPMSVHNGPYFLLYAWSRGFTVKNRTTNWWSLMAKHKALKTKERRSIYSIWNAPASSLLISAMFNGKQIALWSSKARIHRFWCSTGKMPWSLELTCYHYRSLSKCLFDGWTHHRAGAYRDWWWSAVKQGRRIDEQRFIKPIKMCSLPHGIEPNESSVVQGDWRWRVVTVPHKLSRK